MNTGINVIGFFRGVFQAFTGLVRWVNTPIILNGWQIVLNPTDTQIQEALNKGALTPLNLMSIMLVGFLTLMLALHIFHILKPIG